MIYRAILRYGYSGFKLEILEYCSDRAQAVSREQYYIDSLNPEYNILPNAGSLLGYKHPEDSKSKIWTPERKIKRLEQLKHLNQNPEFKAKRLEQLKVLNSSKEQLEHLKRLHENLAIILKGCAKPPRSGRPSVCIKVLDSLTNETTIYSSISEAARAIGVSQAAISKAFKKSDSTVWIKNKRYKITKLP